ncbi:hypothetical protein HMPREF1522_0061 [Actinomyces sp. ICM54]|nr:hypothetical protein HMPREF1522_0061 [Actinomyces sp. ICM54]
MFVNGVTVVQVRLCVHGHNGSGFAAVPLCPFVFRRRWWCCVAPRVLRAPPPGPIGLVCGCLKPPSPLLARARVGLKPPSPLRVRNGCF